MRIEGLNFEGDLVSLCRSQKKRRTAGLFSFLHHGESARLRNFYSIGQQVNQASVRFAVRAFQHFETGS